MFPAGSIIVYTLSIIHRSGTFLPRAIFCSNTSFINFFVGGLISLKSWPNGTTVNPFFPSFVPSALRHICRMLSLWCGISCRVLRFWESHILYRHLRHHEVFFIHKVPKLIIFYTWNALSMTISYSYFSLLTLLRQNKQGLIISIPKLRLLFIIHQSQRIQLHVGFVLSVLAQSSRNQSNSRKKRHCLCLGI